MIIFFCFGYLALLGFSVALGGDWLPNPMAYAEHFIKLVVGKLPKILQPLCVGFVFLFSMILTIVLLFSPMMIVLWSSEHWKTWATITLAITLIVLPASYIVGRSLMDRSE